MLSTMCQSVPDSSPIGGVNHGIEHCKRSRWLSVPKEGSMLGQD